MYGLVNAGIRQLVIANHGEEVWKRVLDKSGVGHAAFLTMRAYDDDVTFKLVEAASDVLETPVEALLEAFGEHWILFTAREGYGPLLDLCGKSFTDFLVGLHALHTRTVVTFPQLKPPVIEVHDVTETTLRVVYRSSRAGLWPMMIGLLRGLGKRFDVEVSSIERTKKREDGGVDEFSVVYREAAA